MVRKMVTVDMMLMLSSINMIGSRFRELSVKNFPQCCETFFIHAFQIEKHTSKVGNDVILNVILNLVQFDTNDIPSKFDPSNI